MTFHSGGRYVFRRGKPVRVECTADAVASDRLDDHTPLEPGESASTTEVAPHTNEDADDVDAQETDSGKA